MVDDGVSVALQRSRDCALRRRPRCAHRRRPEDHPPRAGRGSLGEPHTRRPRQRGHRRGRQNDDQRRAVVSGAHALQPPRRHGRRHWRAASTSARASNPTAPATMTARFCSRFSKGCPTAAATSSSASTPPPTSSTPSSGSNSSSNRSCRASSFRRATACSRTSSSSTAHGPRARRRRVPEPGRHVACARRHGGPRRGRLCRPRQGLRWSLLRDRTGIGGDQRRGRGRRHGDARVRAPTVSPDTCASRWPSPPACALDDRQRRRGLHRS